jgi:hypothetical protein
MSENGFFVAKGIMPREEQILRRSAGEFFPNKKLGGGAGGVCGVGSGWRES